MVAEDIELESDPVRGDQVEVVAADQRGDMAMALEKGEDVLALA
jgi:hypothetical protein